MSRFVLFLLSFFITRKRRVGRIACRSFVLVAKKTKKSKKSDYQPSPGAIKESRLKQERRQRIRAIDSREVEAYALEKKGVVNRETFKWAYVEQLRRAEAMLNPRSTQLQVAAFNEIISKEGNNETTSIET